MKKNWMKSALLGLSAAASLTACEPPVPPTPPAETLDVTEAIKGDTTWKSGNTYILKNHIFVESGTLTLEPGVTVKGSTGTSLVITREAKINAVGTADKPIVFTSINEPGSRRPGDWGGVVLLGKAALNVPDQYIEGFAAGADTRTLYGGGAQGQGDNTHDCGKLKYARIEFAGFRLTANFELNGLTVGACGSRTELDYIQVHRGTDDGIEFFGGTSDLKHAIVTLTDDDGLDWDYGYRGRVQYLIVQQGENLGNMAIEADNFAGNTNALPRSAPEVWNATLIGRPSGGSERSIAMTLRRGTAGKLNNIIITGFADGGVDIQSAASGDQFRAGELYIRNSLFWNLRGNNAIPSQPDSLDNSNVNEATELLATGTGNKVADPQLEAAATSATAPNFKPRAGSEALNVSNAGTPPAGFDTSARFVGAMGTTDWTAGWTSYPAN